MVVLAQGLGAMTSTLHVSGVEAGLDGGTFLMPDLRAAGHPRGLRRHCRHLQGGWSEKSRS